MENTERSPLRLLLKQYNLLDAVCNLSVTVINTSLDIVDAIPPFRPLVESLTWMTESTPRPWLALLKSIRDFHTDVLHDFLDILDHAVEYTYQIFQHTSKNPAISSKDKVLLNKSHLDHIKVRGYVLSNLQAATTNRIDYLSSSHGGVTPLSYLAPSRQLLKGGTGGIQSGLKRALSQDRDSQDSTTLKTQRITSKNIQKLGKPPSGRLNTVLAFEHINGWLILQYHIVVRLTFYIARDRVSSILSFNECFGSNFSYRILRVSRIPASLLGSRASIFLGSKASIKGTSKTTY